MRSLLAILALLATPLMAAEPMPALKGNSAIHDPSILVTETGWASFATGVEGATDGGTIRTKTSPDGITWTEAGAFPGGLAAWIKPELGYQPRNIWAPCTGSGMLGGDLAFTRVSCLLTPAGGWHSALVIHPPGPASALCAHNGPKRSRL